MNADYKRFENLDSTNRTAKELIQLGTATGTVVVAKTQSEGRGSGLRSWHSPEGGLYVSYIVNIPENRPVSLLSLVAGVAVASIVQEAIQGEKPVTVKWPNDVLVRRKKVAGVLSEAMPERGQAIIGIGLNINTGYADLGRFGGKFFGATSLLLETKKSYSIEGILQDLTQELFFFYDRYCLEGPRFLQREWEKRCLFQGREVEFRTGETEVTQGTHLGIDESGSLILADQEGGRKKFSSGEITCCAW